MSIFSKWFSNKTAQTAEAQNSNHPSVSVADYCEKGEKSLVAGRFVEAMEYFQAAIETDKRFEKAYLLLSEAYEKLGKTDKAKATLYALLAVEPNNEKAREGIEVLDESNVVKSKSASTGTITFQTVSSNSNKAQNGNNGVNSNKGKGGDEFWGVFRIVLIIAVILIVDIILIANDILEIHRGGTLLFLIDLFVFVLLGKLFGLGD